MVGGFERERERERERFQMLTCAGVLLKTGKNLCLQYSLNRRVKNIRGMVKPEATGDLFMPKTPRAIICVNTKEKIVVL